MIKILGQSAANKRARNQLFASFANLTMFPKYGNILFVYEQYARKDWMQNMERDYGAWINMLSHKLKKRMNATLSTLISKRRGRRLWPEPLNRHGNPAASGAGRYHPAGKCCLRCPPQEPCSHGKSTGTERAGAGLCEGDRGCADPGHLARPASGLSGGGRQNV